MKRDNILPRLRVPIVAASLLAIVYYAVNLSILVPNYLFEAAWQPDGVLRVVSPYPDTPAAAYLAAGDVILSIDGQPAQRLAFRSLFPPGRSAYTYAVKREDQNLIVQVPNGEITFVLLRRRMTGTAVALGIWCVGTVIILFATPRNRDGWHVSLVTLGLAVTLTASEAAPYGIPTAWLLSDPWLPSVAVAFAQLALIPRSGQLNSVERWGFRALYGLSILIGLISLFEILYLSPRGSSVELLMDVSLYDVILLTAGMGLLLNPLILLGRLLPACPVYQRQQLLILLVFTGIAVLPLTLLTILPRVWTGDPILPWEVSLALLLLIPAAYGYVVYRRNYLSLDLFATRTVSLLSLTFVLLSLYAGSDYLIQRQQLILVPESLSSFFPFSVALAGVALAGRPFRRTTRTLIYGTSATYEANLGRFTAMLSAHPQYETLRTVFREMADLLQVRQAALLLVEGGDRLRRLDSLRLPTDLSLSPHLVDPLPSTPLVRATLDEERDPLGPLFARHPWVELVAPLSMGGDRIGCILLGAQVPDAHFNAQEVRFVQQIAEAMSVATEAMRLFEASREMSRKLLRIRDQERAQLAAQIHDEPLQRISMVASDLERISRQKITCSPALFSSLQEQREALLLIAHQLRVICAGLRPPVLQQGIQWAIREVVDEVGQATNLDINLQLKVSATISIPDDMATTIYHVLVEALNNVHKHARGTGAWVTFTLGQGILRLSVEDNGHGIGIPSLSISDLVRAQHFGMAGMHEWARLVDGSLSVCGRPGGGTQVLLEIPFDLSWELENGTHVER